MADQRLLSSMRNGESARVKSIDASALRVKLLEMGLVEGKRVQVLFRAPLGDPIAVDIDGYTLSLRKDEACLISVEPLSAAS